MSGDTVVIAAVGDTMGGYRPPKMMFELVAEALRAGDIRFAQIEANFSKRGSYQTQAGPGGAHSRLDPELATAYRDVPFDVVSVASNHAGDWGPEAVEDTVETFRNLGIVPVGAGRLPDARKPMVIERKGLRVAFLAYCSVIMAQCCATEERAGAVPMRAKTYYEPYEFAPGTPPRVVTIPYENELRQLVEDVKIAKSQADRVVVSIHWGVHFQPRPLADYQITVGHAAIDAGADVILGHHAHLIQGVELYKGGVIFYSLGNFAFFRPKVWYGTSPRCMPNAEYGVEQVYNKDVAPGASFRWNQFWGNSLLAYVHLDRSGVSKVEMLPAAMNTLTQPEVFSPDHPKFEEIRRYVEWASEAIDGGVPSLSVEGGRLVAFRREP